MEEAASQPSGPMGATAEPPGGRSLLSHGDTPLMLESGQSLVLRGLCPGHGSGTATGLGREGRALPAGSEAAPPRGGHGEPPAAAHGVWAPHHPEERPSLETGGAQRLRKQEEVRWLLKWNQMGFGR